MENSERKYDLTEGVVWRKLLKFALPVLLGTLFQQIYTIADAVIIGQFAGKEALAAIESVYTITKLPVNFFVGLSSGATIIISQYFGAKKQEKVSDACHTALIFAFVGGLLLSILGCILAPSCVRMIQVPEEIYSDAVWYTVIFFSGMAASMTYNIGAGIFRALGNSKTPFYFLIAANILNVLLDLLFVGVFRWGVIGAAITTMLAQLLSAILVVAALIRTDLPCKIHIRKIRFHRLHLAEFFKLGLPVGIQSTLYPISNTIIQTSINSFGVNSIAAWAVCGKLDFLIWFISDAFCVTVSTFVAQNFGATKYQRAKKGVLVGSGISLISIAFIGCLLYFWNAPLGRLLVNDEDVIGITSQIMNFLAPLYVLYVLGAVLPGAIRGFGESVKPMIITLFGSCACRVLWILFVVPLNPTLMTVLTCYPVSWGVTSFIFLLYYIFSVPKLLQRQTAK